MATKELKTRLQCRKATTAEWATSTVPLLQGEIAIEVIDATTVKMKIGTDGVKTFSQLPYFTMNTSELASALGDAAIMSKTLSGYDAAQLTPTQLTAAVSLVQALKYLQTQTNLKMDQGDFDNWKNTELVPNYLQNSILSNTPQAGKVPLMDANGKLPMSITGDADSVDGIQGADLLQKAGGTMSGALILSRDPLSDMEAATKKYVDLARQGMSGKVACKVATTANITLSATQTIDGVAVAVGDRVLVKNQTTASQNGIYIVASGAWTRADDAATAAQLTPGSFVFVERGTSLADTGWLLSTDGPITVGTTALSWIQFSSAGVQDGDGSTIVKTGNVFSHKSGVATPGTFKSVTVDTYGRVTSGTNPTTLAGYGITDAQANIAPGGTDDYYAGDKTWKSLSTAVRSVVLTGLSVATSAVISATDSVLSALGKLQAQITGHVGRTDNPHSVTKAQVGLGSVDNTSDASKPISTATQTALNAKVNTTTKVAGKALSADVAISLYDLVDVSAGDTVILSGGGANG